MSPQSFGNAFGASGRTDPGSNDQSNRLQLANAADSMRPQLGGMRVIDMTNAPPPPGYSPSNYAPQYPLNQFSGDQLAGNQPATFQSQPGFSNDSGFANNGGFVDRNIAPTSFTSPIGAANQPARIATVPFGPSVTSSSSLNTQQLPSTAPINSTINNQADQLRWRRPTSQF